MNRTDSAGHVDSYYAATAHGDHRRPSLDGSLRADVAVVGGGYTGVSTALHLAERGFDVVLLEGNRLGWGASGRNGGHVGIGQRKGQQELEALLGAAAARELWQLGLEAPRLVLELIATHAIDCDLKRGVLHVAAKPAHARELRSEVDHLRSAYGYDAVRYVARDELHQLIGTRRYHGGELYTEAAHLHPLNYLLGLAAAAERAGARLFERSHVSGIRAADGGVTLQTAAGTVHAAHAVLGCNGYLGTLERRIAPRIMPINNFVLATEPLGEDLARELIRDDCAVADTLFVINYWKLSADKRLLFGGGENYTSRFPRDLKSFVRRYMLRVYPQLAGRRIDYAWGGTLGVTMNRLPSFGRLEANVYYAQGYSGHGVPTATLAGKLVAEAIAGTAERFDVFARLPVRPFPGGTLLRWPGLVLGMSYYALRDRLG